MPKPVSFTPHKRQGRPGWWLNIPPKLSDTGKRQRLSFETKTLAKVEGQKRARSLQTTGHAAVLRADVAVAALEALAILEPYGATLVEAAKEFAAKREQQAKSIAFGEACDLYITRKRKKKYSDAYLNNFNYVRKRLPEDIENTLVCDLTKEQIELAAKAVGPTDDTFALGFRVLRAVLNWSVDKREWAEKHEASKIECDNPETAEVATIVTLGEAQAVVDSCRDWRGEKGGLDCSDCLPAFAIMLFAGIRPAELDRLEWSDVDFETENIRVPGSKSKTNTLRNVHIEANLMAWLSACGDSVGMVKPRNWKRKGQLVRRKAGIRGKHDILRHSYGSYWLAVHGDTATLQSYMGHKHVTTYLDHYHQAVKKRDALKFWKIAPDQTTSTKAPGAAVA